MASAASCGERRSRPVGRRGPLWRRAGTSGGRTFLAMASIALSLAAPQTAQALGIGTPAIKNTPLDLVVLVDESGSESNLDVKHEMEAAGTIAQALLNPQSRVAVVGFGGADGVVPNQDPTMIVCQPTITNGFAGLEYLARCVNELHRRTSVEGDNTDYAAALGQAMSFLSQGTPAPANAIKAIVMMTDGGLDVSGDPQYPQPNWLPAAHHAVNLQLAAAQTAGVQIWPLGFGNLSRANVRYLDYLAANGGQQSCDHAALLAHTPWLLRIQPGHWPPSTPCMLRPAATALAPVEPSCCRAGIPGC